MSQRDLLWPGAEVYDRRFEKSAVALIAVRRALSSDQSLVGRVPEFLRLYDFVSRSDADTFTRVWSDPVAYFWVRRAVHFMAACRGEPMGTVERAYCAQIGVDNPKDALGSHLGDFKRFALGAAAIAGADITFDEPYKASLPLSIPGTEFIVVGRGKTKIAGFRDGAIELCEPARLLPLSDSASGSRPEIRIESCPVLSIGNGHVYLNPATFNVPGVGFPLEWTGLPLDFQVQHSPAASEAMSLIRRFQPETFAHMESALHTIAFKPLDDGFFNVSASDLPATFLCSVPPTDPHALAGSFVHEFHHNTLFCIEEAGPFLAASEDDEIEGENHYSPWVDKLRPLHGILHAVYVFIPVFHFWSAVLKDGSTDEGKLAYTREAIARIPVQLRIGINQLQRHAKFTPFGVSIFREMTREVEEIEAESQRLGASLKSTVIGMDASGRFRPFIDPGAPRPKNVGETLIEHIEQIDERGECAREKAHILNEIS